jgi:hypothetical protein
MRVCFELMTSPEAQVPGPTLILETNEAARRSSLDIPDWGLVARKMRITMRIRH